MAYNITSSDNSISLNIPDGNLDQTTSLTFPGPNFVGYGYYLNENLFHLLENFAANLAPGGTNVQGQLWFDKYHQTLRVYTATGYVPVSGITNSTLEPSTPNIGDIWYNQSSGQTFLYDNGQFNLVGPQYTLTQGVSGAIPVVVDDSGVSGVHHNIIALQYGKTIIATLNSDATFIPAGFDPGFPTIKSGLTFNSNISNPTVNSNLIGNVTGNLTGNVTSTTITATNLFGTLTGSLNGSVVGPVTGNVIGDVAGNLVATTVQVSNLSSANAQITGGSVTGLTNFTTAMSQATNFSSGNAVITGGAITVSVLNSTTSRATNFSSGNAVITGGYINSLANLSSTTANFTTLITGTATATNFSSGNIQVTGGNLNSIVNFSASNGTMTNLSVANLIVAGGTTVNSSGSFTNLTATNITASNVIILGGNVSNTTGSNVTLNNASVANSTATTKATTDKSTAIATTAFVHNVLPTGVIVMWGGAANAIPAGWVLCDGSGTTPDLRGQFIVGASATGGYPVGATGGANSVTLDTTMIPDHTHSINLTGSTNSAGGHNHVVSDSGHNHVIGIQGGNGSVNAANSLVGAPSQDTGRRTGTSTTGITLGAVGDHTHSLTVTGTSGSTGNSQPHENRPPFYALCYIQKVY